MSEGPRESPQSYDSNEIPKVFTEPTRFRKNEDIVTVGSQIINARKRIADYQDNPEAIGQDWPALKGNEEKLLKVVNKVATEQISDIAEVKPATTPPDINMERKNLGSQFEASSIK